MFVLLLLAALCTMCQTDTVRPNFYFSRSVGRGAGRPLDSRGGGCVTAVRVWSFATAYITGIQLRHGNVWTPRMGRDAGTMDEIILFDKERIVQISGKYSPSNYVYQLFFVTSRRRSLIVGQPTKISFNFYARSLSHALYRLNVRFDGRGITAVGALWGGLQH